MDTSSIAPLMSTLVPSESSSQQAHHQWQVYKSLRPSKMQLAKTAWHRLLTESDKRVCVRQFDPSTPAASIELGLAGLTKSGTIWSEENPPHLEPKVVILLLSLVAKHPGIGLPTQHRVNYHGHVCAYASNVPGKMLPWDEEEAAFRVTEREEVILEAYLSSTQEGMPEVAPRAEMEVVGGTQRAVVPFQVEAEGYPLRFLNRSRYDKLDVPLKGKSDILRFPVNPESLIVRPRESNRVPVWINVRQHNALVQCVCVPLLILPKKAKTKKTAPKRS